MNLLKEIANIWIVYDALIIGAAGIIILMGAFASFLVVIDGHNHRRAEVERVRFDEQCAAFHGKPYRRWANDSQPFCIDPRTNKAIEGHRSFAGGGI